MTNKINKYQMLSDNFGYFGEPVTINDMIENFDRCCGDWDVDPSLRETFEEWGNCLWYDGEEIAVLIDDDE